MTVELNKEIDTRLREVVADQSNLWSALALVRAFHNEKVLASDKLYAIADKEVPVFTDSQDLENFLETEATAKEQNWVQRSILEVLEEAIRNQQAALTFNPKAEGDLGNRIKMKTADMIEFINHHTQILNILLSQSNQEADVKDKFYFVPIHVSHSVEGEVRRQMSLLVNPDKERFVPVFSNMTSFARWYNHENFGGPFRQRQGKMIVWKLSDLTNPKEGENKLDGALGVVVNPFVEDKTLTWKELEG